MRFAARILTILLITIVLFFSLKTSSVNAQTNAQNAIQTFNTSTNKDVPKDMHFFSQGVVLELMSAMVCQLAGFDPVNPSQACLGIDRQTGKIGFVKNGGGLVMVVGKLIDNTIFVPVHVSDYTSYVSQNFGFPKTTYAQGIGFVGLRPVLSIFTIFRNMSYLLFVFIFVLVGVAIMLRVKIDPRTVMTIQNQIPKLIIGLVMITFSYAIAGLVIDGMWVGTYFLINTIVPTTEKANITNSLTQSTPGFVGNVYQDNNGIFGISMGAARGAGDIIRQAIHPDTLIGVGDQTSCTDFFCVITHISGIIGNIISLALSWLVGLVVGIIAFLIFVIAILVQLFKLWFALLKSFISVILDVILAPFWIIAGLLPGAGQNVGFGAWLRDIVANLAVFPAAVFLFLMSKVVLDGFATNISPTAFNPPLIGNATGTGNGTDFGSLLAVGFILASPGIVDQVKKALKAAGPGAGLGGVGTSAAMLGAIGGAVGSKLYYKDREGNLQGAIGNRVAASQNRVLRSRPVRAMLGVNENPYERQLANQQRKETIKRAMQKVLGQTPPPTGPTNPPPPPPPPAGPKTNP